MEPHDPLRILQVLGTTDADDAGRRALDLHAALDRQGQATRSVALGPGRRGGLDGLLPVLGPSSRSISARTQLRRERRWADVVVLNGPAAVQAASSRWLTGGPPAVALLDEPSLPMLASGAAAPTQLRGVVVATGDGAPPATAGGLRGDLRVVAVPVAVDVRSAPTTPAARAEARRLLGLGPDGAVVLVVGEGSDPDAARRWSDALRGAGMTLLDPSGDPEVDLAAVDVVAWPGSPGAALPPRDLLVAAASGAAVVVGSGAAAATLADGGALVVGDDGEVTTTLDTLRDPEERRARGERAAELVRRHHDLDSVSTVVVAALADAVG